MLVTRPSTSARSSPASARAARSDSTARSVGERSGNRPNADVPTPTIAVVPPSRYCRAIATSSSRGEGRASVRLGHVQHVLAEVGEHEVVRDGGGLVQPRLPELAFDVELRG